MTQLNENFIPLRKSDKLSNLPLLTRVIYAEIESLCSKSGICFATNGYFAEQFRVSSKTASFHINKLKRLDLIEVTKNPSKLGAVRIIRMKLDATPPAPQIKFRNQDTPNR